MSAPDLAPLIAAYLHTKPAEDVKALIAAVKARWPAATPEEIGRGAKIAAELSRADAADYFAKSEALERGDASLLTAEDWEAIHARRASGGGQ